MGVCVCVGRCAAWWGRLFGGASVPAVHSLPAELSNFHFPAYGCRCFATRPTLLFPSVVDKSPVWRAVSFQPSLSYVFLYPGSHLFRPPC